MDNPKYFGGDASNMGMVSSLPIQTFKQLVEQYLNATIQLSMTRREFFDLTGRKRDSAKMVPYLVPASFRDDPSRRLTSKAVSVSLVFLDIDPEKGDGNSPVQYPAKPLLENPDLFNRQLGGLNHAVHTTAQSRPEAPRCRVIVEADNLPVGSYRAAVLHVAKLLGLKVVTPESGVVVQAMFRPTTFSDTNTETDHPLVTYRTNGRALRVEEIEEKGEKPFFTSGRGAGKDGVDVSGDALAFLRPPVEGVEFDNVKEALSFIHPDIPYRDWLEIAAALKHQFPTGEDLEQAYQLFDTWSSAGEKYNGGEETRAKWDSFRPTPLGRVPVTIRSIFHRAAVGGWDSKAQKQRIFQSVKKFIQAYPSLSGFFEESIKKIVASPLLSTLDEEGLLNDLRAKADKEFEHTVGIAHLRKELKKQKAIIEKAKEEEKEQDAPPPPWAKGVCYVEQPNLFYRFSTKARLSPVSFNNAYSRYLLPSKEALEASGQANSPAAAARPIIEPADYILNLLQVDTAYDFYYDPRKPNSQFVLQEGKYCVNTFRADYPEPEHKQMQEAKDFIEGHVAVLIKDPEYQKLLLSFMAYMVQFPGHKIRWGTLIQGAEGCGKGFLEQVMRKVLGRGNVKKVAPDTLFQKWTEWTMGSQLVCLNEVRVVGHSRYDVMNRLKEPISDDYISIAERNTNHREVENLTNYLLFTNYHDALALSPNERRYFVLKSRIQSREKVLRMQKEGYFRILFKKLDELGGGLRAYFEEYELHPDFEPQGVAPNTEFLEQMKADTAPEASYSIDEALEESDDPLVAEDLVATGALIKALRQKGVKTSVQSVTSVLRAKGWVKQGRYRINGDRETLWLKDNSELEGLNLGKIATTRLNQQTEQILKG